MSNIWFISDTHFNHANVLKFTYYEGGPKIRPDFETVEEMNEVMIQNWNKAIKPEDKVYHLGDVMFGNSKHYYSILSRLNGKKRLIVGNHDDIKDPALSSHFQKIQMWNYFKEHDFLVTHVPIIRPEICKVKFNVHGHIHQNDDPSPVHLNISVEKTNFAPIHLDEVKARLAKK